MTHFDDMELFRWACRDDEHAARFLKDITDVAHVWDDVVDGDHLPSAERINWAFRLLVVDIPANAFYRLHRDTLDPIIALGACNWMVATGIERTRDAPLHVAYILRSSYIDLVTHVAALIGGPEWSRAVCAKVRTINQSETFDDYLAALDAEAAMRDAAQGAA